jgi:hypothetical protein
MLLLLTILAALAVGGVAWAQTSATPLVLYRWIDEQGRAHYVENLTDVPERFRPAAVKGLFTPNAPYQANAPLSGQLDVVEDTYYREDNFYHIKGRVRNGFSQTVNQVKVKITFFDEAERFLMTETTLVDPLSLIPGEEGRFHLMVKLNPKIDSYRVEVLGRP